MIYEIYDLIKFCYETVISILILSIMLYIGIHVLCNISIPPKQEVTL